MRTLAPLLLATLTFAATPVGAQTPAAADPLGRCPPVLA